LIEHLRSDTEDVVTACSAALFNFAWHDPPLVIGGLNNLIHVLQHRGAPGVANSLDIFTHLAKQFPKEVVTVPNLKVVIATMEKTREVQVRAQKIHRCLTVILMIRTIT
jgi:hypothetical protein